MEIGAGSRFHRPDLHPAWLPRPADLPHDQLTTSAGVSGKGSSRPTSKALLHAAHAQLGGPISLVWDSLPEHVSAQMRRWITTQADWLVVYRLPPYSRPTSTRPRASGRTCALPCSTSPSAASMSSPL